MVALNRQDIVIAAARGLHRISVGVAGMVASG
jgi:hypothetical protein